MHIVTGGAANGKAVWVKETYNLDEKQDKWFNAEETSFSTFNLEKMQGIVVIEAIEHWVYEWLKDSDLDTVRNDGKQEIDEWLLWEESNEENNLIIICTDISKGIVPMEKTLRNWRDVTGWFYQDLVEAATKVNYIWYGIAKQLK
ncbi:bifunctional adenosylcobinamide kinase/adenosylcobinamide-phosphate guanylyltransferase [Oceanobacillus sp. CAU 1775]